MKSNTTVVVSVSVPRLGSPRRLPGFSGLSLSSFMLMLTSSLPVETDSFLLLSLPDFLAFVTSVTRVSLFAPPPSISPVFPSVGAQTDLFPELLVSCPYMVDVSSSFLDCLYTSGPYTPGTRSRDTNKPHEYANDSPADLSYTHQFRAFLSRWRKCFH